MNSESVLSCTGRQYLYVICLITQLVHANLPYFFLDANMALVLVPYDVPVGSTIYRLKAADSDLQYPLTFSVPDAVGRSLVSLQPYTCSVHEDFCVCDVQLRRPLEAGVTSTFRVRVMDTAGQVTTVVAKLAATEGHSSVEDTFLDLMKPIRVAEDSPINTIIKTITAKRGNRNIKFDIRGTDALSLENSRLTRSGAAVDLVLRSELDFETQNLFEFNIFAEHGFRDTSIDTRNVVSMSTILLVEDIQDSPPRFVQAPSVAILHPNIQAGEVIAHFSALDTDKADPREIRYRLHSKDSIAFNNYFSIDHRSGNLTVTSALGDLGAAFTESVVLHILAEEVTRSLAERPALSAMTELAVIVKSDTTHAPSFAQSSYVALLPENPLPGLVVVFSPPSRTIIRFPQHQRGTFELNIVGDLAEKSFEIVPSIIKADSEFDIRVKNGLPLDFETLRPSRIKFKVEAEQLDHEPSRAPLRSHCNFSIDIQDLNDNSPVFDKKVYDVVIKENVVRGTVILKMSATDSDSGDNGLVTYSGLTGDNEDDLSLDPATGEIRVKVNRHGFDYEQQSEYRLQVLAADNGLPSRTGTATVRVQVLDVNDNAPQFSRSVYNGKISADGSSLVEPVRVIATDKDSGVNGKISYRISGGDTQRSYFSIDRSTGIIQMRKRLPLEDMSEQLLSPEPRREAEKLSDLVKNYPGGAILLKVIALDSGSPQLSSEVSVYMFKKETIETFMTFVVGRSPAFVSTNLERVEDELSSFTGGSAEITDVSAYNRRDGRNMLQKDKSVITAIVRRRFDAAFDATSFSQDLTGTDIRLASVNDVWFWLLIALVILIAVIIGIVSCCFYCSFCAACCPDISCYRRKLMPVVEEDRVAYIALDKNLPTSWARPTGKDRGKRHGSRLASPNRSVRSHLAWSESGHPPVVKRLVASRTSSRATNSTNPAREKILLVRHEAPEPLNESHGNSQVILLPEELDGLRRTHSRNSWEGARVYHVRNNSVPTTLIEATPRSEFGKNRLYHVEDIDESELERLELERRSVAPDSNRAIPRRFSPSVEVLTFEEGPDRDSVYRQHGNVEVLHIAPRSGPSRVDTLLNESRQFSYRSQEESRLNNERTINSSQENVTRFEANRNEADHTNVVSSNNNIVHNHIMPAEAQYSEQHENRPPGKTIIMKRFMDSHQEQMEMEEDGENKHESMEKRREFISADATSRQSDYLSSNNRDTVKSQMRVLRIESYPESERENQGQIKDATAASAGTPHYNQAKDVEISSKHTQAFYQEESTVVRDGLSRPDSSTSLRYSNNMVRQHSAGERTSTSQSKLERSKQSLVDSRGTVSVDNTFSSEFASRPQTKVSSTEINGNDPNVSTSHLQPSTQDVRVKKSVHYANSDQYSSNGLVGQTDQQKLNEQNENPIHDVTKEKTTNLTKTRRYNGRPRRRPANGKISGVDKTNVHNNNTSSMKQAGKNQDVNTKDQQEVRPNDVSGDSGIGVEARAHDTHNVQDNALSGNESTISSTLVPGIKRKRNQFLEKKSIFTIAYDDIRTEKLRGDTPNCNDI